ncbi:MAG: error-prone DNA polymerase [Anaerolineae bacterium]|nr:error-prone DNA polymerase [Anaerolineae bacterium]
MDYVELHTHSNFSFLDGASHPENLLQRAAELKHSALALTDHDNVSGAVRFSQAAKEYGVRPIFGAEITLHDGHHLLLLVKNQTGWANLCTLVTLAQHAAPKGEAKLPADALKGHTDGLIALSGCRKGAIPAALLRGDRRAALAIAQRCADLFGKENFFIELHNHLLRDDKSLIRQLVLLAKQVGVEYVATNNVHYAMSDGHGLQDLLVAIKHKLKIEELRHLRRPSHEYYLKSADEMAVLFEDYPLAISNTVKIAEQCRFDLQHGIQEMPAYPLPDGMTAIAYLRQLCLEAISRRYPNASPDLLDRIHQRIEHELSIIAQTHSEHYYLLVWGICRFAQRQRIWYNGRGSGANSIVAYLLFISPVDPLQYNLVFERFLSPERQAGDFDIDFESGRRPEIIAYLFDKYGVDHAAMVANVITFKARSSLRDIAKRLGIPEDAIPSLRAELDLFEQDIRKNSGLAGGSQAKGITWRYLIDFAGQLHAFPRHLGQHNGGFVITRKPIHHYVATEPTRMKDRFVIQWDKDSIGDMGWVKVDILGLKILDVIAETLRRIEERTGEQISFDNLRYDDPKVYAMLTLADTIGVFQLDSRAQSQNLPFQRPKKFADIVIAISLIRPGPIIAGTVHAYFCRLLGQESVTYLHPSLKDALADSLGTLLWQEQVALVAHALAGFTLGEGEQMRRSLGKKYAGSEIERWEAKFIAGAAARGVSDEVAHKVFEQIKAFGSYAFPRAHAAAFAVLVYQSAWLKCYFPADYAVACLNNMPVGFWGPNVVVSDARRRGIEILPVSINKSGAKCAVENGGIRLGFNYVTTLGDTGAAKIEAARGSQPFVDLTDFYKRTRLPESQIENLIICGAMEEWKVPRRELLWRLGTVAAQVNQLGLVFEEELVDLPPLTQAEKLRAELTVLGFSPDDHVMAHYRDWLNKKGVTTSEQLKRCRDGQKVRIAGVSMVLQRPPTAKGFAFLTLQDEFFAEKDAFYMMDIIISPKVYDAHHRIVRKLLLAVDGRVQKRGNIINIIAERIYDLQERANASSV